MMSLNKIVPKRRAHDMHTHTKKMTWDNALLLESSRSFGSLFQLNRGMALNRMGHKKMKQSTLTGKLVTTRHKAGTASNV